jgi:crossover junction endodeoxyribonuclease RuvC
MKFVGVDPGLAGACAVLDTEAGTLIVTDTPTAIVKKSTSDYLIAGMLALLPEGGFAALERGIALPRQSSVSTYNTGRGAGIWEALLTARGISFERPMPSQWKKTMGFKPGADKSASRLMASQLFPTHAMLFSRARDDGRAEAALLAEWRRRLG